MKNYDDERAEMIFNLFLWVFLILVIIIYFML